jgi:hypothetical protein
MEGYHLEFRIASNSTEFLRYWREREYHIMRTFYILNPDVRINRNIDYTKVVWTQISFIRLLIVYNPKSLIGILANLCYFPMFIKHDINYDGEICLRNSFVENEVTNFWNSLKERDLFCIEDRTFAPRCENIKTMSEQ